jgi:hypothetical protein
MWLLTTRNRLQSAGVSKKSTIVLLLRMFGTSLQADYFRGVRRGAQQNRSQIECANTMCCKRGSNPSLPANKNKKATLAVAFLFLLSGDLIEPTGSTKSPGAILDSGTKWS